MSFKPTQADPLAKVSVAAVMQNWYELSHILEWMKWQCCYRALFSLSASLFDNSFFFWNTCRYSWKCSVLGDCARSHILHFFLSLHVIVKMYKSNLFENIMSLCFFSHKKKPFPFYTQIASRIRGTLKHSSFLEARDSLQTRNISVWNKNDKTRLVDSLIFCQFRLVADNKSRPLIYSPNNTVSVCAFYE